MENSSIKFSCPNCGQHLSAEEELFDTQIECPACAETIMVPSGVNRHEVIDLKSSKPDVADILISSDSLPEDIHPLNPVDSSVPPVPPPLNSTSPPSEGISWFRQTWFHVLLFVFLPYIQVPLMWFLKIFSFRARIILSVVGLILTISYLSDDSENSSGGIFSSSEDRAKESAKSLVLESLKSPSTANFPEIRILHEEHPWYQVFVFVDAQNSYGAYVRSSYVCVLKLEDDGKFSHRPGAGIQELDQAQIDTAGFDLLKVIREGNNWPESK